ncbi:unnamed protein product [Candida verbasci]|uniref:Uncharacterized protein n=1 Tax=Candida verbasci TaxID=1227364 RepID=A0A9W4TT58_9ASCO|nr:unnamed protein product [Candida verbasci]
MFSPLIRKPRISIIGNRLFSISPYSYKLFRKQQQQPSPPSSKASGTGPSDLDFKTHPILKRIPKFMQNYSLKFINAPFSNLLSFIIVHELTAIIPLVGIWYYLHQHPGLIPIDLPTWALEKGGKVLDKVVSQYFTDFDSSSKINFIMEGAYAFTIVKFFLPLRILVSLWAMPHFAKWAILPITNIFKNFKELRRLKKIKREKKGLDEVKTKSVDKPKL